MDYFFWRVGDCQSPAVYVVEGYTGKNGMAHGSLDRISYCCAEHLEKARQRIIRDGMSPYTSSAKVPADRVCGEISDYVDKVSGEKR